MSFGYGVGDIMAISGLAVKVYTAYKDAPDDYRNISDEVVSLHIIINKAARHFESTTLSHDEQQEGLKILKGCENVLKDLDSLIGKYQGLASISTSQVLQRVKLGTEDIATLRARLISNTGLLNGFIQSCGLIKMQAEMNKVLGLQRTNSQDSVISFAGSINTKKAYKRFCKGLFGIGVTAEMISQKEGEIHKIFKPSNTATSSQIDDDTIVGNPSDPSAETSSISTNKVPISISTEDKSNQNRSRFSWVRPPPIDFIVGPLMLAAAEAGNIQRLTSTLEYIRDINFQDDQKETALHKAADKGYTSMVELLLTKGASISIGAINRDKSIPVRSMNRHESTPLHLAVWNGHTSTVELLLTKGAPIEARADFMTPLHIAASNGHTSMVELLLMKGASIEAKYNIYTPLHIAAQNGHTSTVKLLLMKGASTEAQSHDVTLLHTAAQNGYTSTVELLLTSGASIETTDFRGNTPLHIAAQYGHTSIVELLLSKGASIEATDNNDNTPLNIAAQNGHTSTMELLLTKGASIEATDYSDNTPLHLAAENGHTNTVELLLMKGASIGAIARYNVCDNVTPLHLAAENGHTSMVKLLLSKGASIEGHSSYTPLHLAASKGHTSTVELLLTKGASVQAINKNNNTPLHLAAEGGHTCTVELLLLKGASIEAKNYDNNTPLHLAVFCGHTSTVELLLTKGASIEVMNKDNDTPLWLATLRGRTDLVKLLENKAVKPAILSKMQALSE